MSKYHPPRSQERVARAIQTMSSEEVEQYYGVEINEDGTVFDVCEGKVFDTLVEWALFMDESEDAIVEAKMYKGNVRYAFDDD